MHKILLYTFVFLNAYILSAQVDSVISIQPVTIEKVSSTIIPKNEYDLQKEVFVNTPSQNVAEASSWTPGIYLKDYGGIGGLKTISSKGLSSNYTGVFLNGTKVENTLSTQIDLGKFDLIGCSEVSITQNTSKELLKPASFYISPTNVVINMKPIDSNFVNLGLKTGSFGLINPSLSAATNLNSKNSLFFNSSYTTANGKYPFQYNNGTETLNETREGADVKRFNTYIDHVYTINESIELNTQIRTNYNNQGLPGAVVLYNPTSRQSLKSSDLQGSTNLINTKNKLKWRTGFNYSQSSLSYLDTSYFNTIGYLQQDYNQYSYTSSNSISYKILPKTTLTSAVDYSLSLLRKDKTINRKNTNIHIGIEQKIKSLNIKAFYLNQNISDNNEDNSSYSNSSKSGGVSVKYYPFTTSPLKLYGNIGKYIRNPNFQELYYLRVLGDLKPENTSSYNLGINYFRINKQKNISWSVDIKYFNNSVRDKIISTPSQNLFIWSIQNLGKVDIQGFESIVSISIKLDSSFSIYYSNSYTYQQALDKTSSSNREYENQIAYTPFDISKHILMLKHKKSVLTLSSMYNGIRYSLGENIEANLLNGWWVNNISIGQIIPIKESDLTIQFQLNNFFDKQYQIIKNFPMPGRHWYLTTSLKI